MEASGSATNVVTPQSFVMRRRSEYAVSGASPEIVSDSASPSVATASGENAATVSKPSVDASSRIAADVPPVPNAVAAPVAASVVNPRSKNDAVPAGAPGESVVKEAAAVVDSS